MAGMRKPVAIGLISCDGSTSAHHQDTVRELRISAASVAFLYGMLVYFEPVYHALGFERFLSVVTRSTLKPTLFARST